MPVLRPVLRNGHHLGAVFGHQDRVFELSRRLSVFGAYRPAIARVANRFLGAAVDHRFDGEANPRMQSVPARLRAGDVRDVGTLVELKPDSVADILFDDAEVFVVATYMVNDGLTDHRHSAARFDRHDRQMQAVEGTLRNSPRKVAHVFGITDQKRFGLVAVPALNDRGQIDVYDVAGFQFVGAGNSVADHFIDADAATFRKGKFFPWVA